MMANESKMRALHIIQKIMSRPDSADVFKRFDIDGDGTVDRGELKQVTETPECSGRRQLSLCPCVCAGTAADRRDDQ